MLNYNLFALYHLPKIISTSEIMNTNHLIINYFINVPQPQIKKYIIALLGIYSRENKTWIQNLYTNVHINFICNSQKVYKQSKSFNG